MVILKKRKSFLKFIPFFFIFLFICISSTIKPPQGYGMTFSFIPVICIIFWSLQIGKFLGIFQCLFIGILTDFLLGTPLGSNILLFSVIRFISLKAKEKFQIDSFFLNILSSIPLIILFFILNILFYAIYYSTFIINEYYVLNIILTILLYPALAVFFQWIYNIASLEKLYAET